MSSFKPAIRWLVACVLITCFGRQGTQCLAVPVQPMPDNAPATYQTRLTSARPVGISFEGNSASLARLPLETEVGLARADDSYNRKRLRLDELENGGALFGLRQPKQKDYSPAENKLVEALKPWDLLSFGAQQLAGPRSVRKEPANAYPIGRQVARREQSSRVWHPAFQPPATYLNNQFTGEDQLTKARPRPARQGHQGRMYPSLDPESTLMQDIKQIADRYDKMYAKGIGSQAEVVIPTPIHSHSIGDYETKRVENGRGWNTLRGMWGKRSTMPARNDALTGAYAWRGEPTLARADETQPSEERGDQQQQLALWPQSIRAM